MSEVTIDPKRLQAFSDEYAAQSDRAAGVLVGVELDEALKRLLQAFFVARPAPLITRLFADTRVLGSTSVKIDLAEALALLPPELTNSLRSLNRIRNRCAHERNVAFDQPPISQLAGSLFGADLAEQLHPGSPAPYRFQPLSRLQVFSSAFLIISALDALSARIQPHRPVEPPSELKLSFSAWPEESGT